MSRARAVLAVAAVAAALLAAPVAPADASPPGQSTRDSATAVGHDFFSFHEADVIAGSPGNYLVITYTAGRALTDGTVAVVLPGGQWRTPLSIIGSLLVAGPASAGGVAIRPLPGLNPGLPEPGLDLANACTPVGAGEVGPPFSARVQTVLGSQVIVVRHVNCAPGQHLFVHINGITAPARVGRYLLPVVAAEAGELPRLSAASVDVVPTPRVALQVAVPPTVQLGMPVSVQVRAVRPDGRTATGYTGAVALVTENMQDCAFRPSQVDAFQFSAADRGVASIPVVFGQTVAHRLRAYDVGHKAIDGVSAPFEVLGSGPGSSCPAPASYH